MQQGHSLNPAKKSAGFIRPLWLPAHLPELDGLRGVAILAVFFYHCHPRLAGMWIDSAVLWGWSGVNLFFVLSGFLITSILLQARWQTRHYFRNFYARRALRIWPLYYLLIAGCYFGPKWLLGDAQSVQPGTWVALIFFVQNLFHLQLAGSLLPTWSLAIEEQYYVVWAPVVRLLRRPWQLAAVLIAVLAASPYVRLRFGNVLEPLNTLVQLDCIACGSLIAVGMMRLHWARRAWLWTGIACVVIGFGGVASVANGTVFMGTALGLGFGGVVLTAIAATGARNPIAWLLRYGPLPFYGRISYGMYLIHIPLFIWMGALDIRLDHSAMAGAAGNLIIVAARLIVCTTVAVLLWHGFEKRILRLKRYFPENAEARSV